MNFGPHCNLVESLLHAYTHACLHQKIYQYFNYFCVPHDDKSIVHMCQLTSDNKELWKVQGQPDSFFLNERHIQHNVAIDECLTHNIPPLKKYMRLGRIITNYDHYFVIVTHESQTICVFRLNDSVRNELFQEQLIIQSKKESIELRLHDVNVSLLDEYKHIWDNLLVNLAALHIPVKPLEKHMLKCESFFRSVTARYFRRFIFSNHILNAIDKMSFSIKIDLDQTCTIVPYFLEPSEETTEKDLVTISIPLFFLYKRYLENNIRIPNRLHVVSFFVYNHVLNSFLIPAHDTYLFGILCNHSFYKCIKTQDFYHVSFNNESLKTHIVSLLELFENTMASYDTIYLFKKMQRSNPQSPELVSSPYWSTNDKSSPCHSPPMRPSPRPGSKKSSTDHTLFHRSPLSALLQSRPSSQVMETLPETSAQECTRSLSS